jgi:hypothetical protein
LIDRQLLAALVLPTLDESGVDVLVQFARWIVRDVQQFDLRRRAAGFLPAFAPSKRVRDQQETRCRDNPRDNRFDHLLQPARHGARPQLLASTDGFRGEFHSVAPSLAGRDPGDRLCRNVAQRALCQKLH